jgi:hypothetical protein
LPQRPRLKLLAALLALVPLGGAMAQQPREAIGLFTTLPLYWPEAQDVAELIGSDATPHWARGAIEHDFDLLPLDALAGEGAQLNGVRYLLLAQPRMLSPAENVALDTWVRGGGRLLLFADPMLTGESKFAIGDKRRPQDVALLSPILSHWGLELRFDENELAGEHLVELDTFAVPVDATGRFAFLPSDEPGTACYPRAGGLIAECAIGKGSAIVVADAALFDGTGDDPRRSTALKLLLTYAFKRPG